MSELSFLPRRDAASAVVRCGLACAAAVTLASHATAAFTGRTLVASGLSGPMFTTHAPGDPTRLFVMERGQPVGGDVGNSSARIRIIDLVNGGVKTTPFLTINGVDTDGEGGMLGMAFHPDYATNGKFYVYLTANDSVSGTPFSSYIRQYSVSADPDVANTGFTQVMQWTQPQSNHNGGWIGFSPNDGYLYIMSGDGGSSNDSGTGHTEPGGNALDITSNFLGKALRIDVNGDAFPGDTTRNYAIPPSNPFTAGKPNEAGDDEIWAYGLRNPFRAGFDRATGDLWIGDVGQDRREEVNFQAGDSAGGENYGWRVREGFLNTGLLGTAVNPVNPVWDYKQSDAPDVTPADANFLGQSVIGGVPYRGPDPTLQGLYFFADNATNRLWTLARSETGGAPTVTYVTPALPANTGFPTSPSAISEDANGNLYITYLSGAVYRIATNAVTPGDFDSNAQVSDADFAIWQANFDRTTGGTNALGDADGDGDVDGGDFLAWQQNYGYSALDVAGPGSTGVPEPHAAALAAAGIAALGAGRRRSVVVEFGIV